MSEITEPAETPVKEVKKRVRNRSRLRRNDDMRNALAARAVAAFIAVFFAEAVVTEAAKAVAKLLKFVATKIP